MLDNRCRLIRDKVLSVGTSTGSMVSVRENLRRHWITGLLLLYFFITIHRETRLQAERIWKVTRSVMEAGKIIGIELLDHIVIGDNSYFSFKQMQYIN